MDKKPFGSLWSGILPHRKGGDFSAREKFAPPVTLNKGSDKANDSAFSAGYDCLSQSLVGHAFDEGQFPLTSFVGYGVLENIAQNGMIRACISTVADDMTRRWITIEGGDEESSRFEELQDAQENRYKLRRVFNEAWQKVGYFGGCLIFIDTGAEDEDLELPLDISSKSAEFGKGRPLSFRVIDPVNLTPVVENFNQPLKGDFMKPEAWIVLGKRVHASRLIRIVDNEPPQLLKPNYNFLGIPQAQILWDYVLHWNKSRVEAVDLLEKLNLMVFQTNMEDIMQSDGIASLDIRMEALNRFRSNGALFVCDKTNEDIKNITASISGVFDIVKQALEFVAAINRTPAVKLLGISPSGFNATGESDIRNYYDHVQSKQEKFRTAIQTCLDAIQLAEYGEIDDSLTFSFNALGEEDRAAQMTTAQGYVTTLTNLLDRNVVSAEEVRQVVRADETLGLAGLSDDMPEPVEGDLQAGEEQENPFLSGASGVGESEEQPVQSSPIPEPPAEKGETDAEEA